MPTTLADPAGWIYIAGLVIVLIGIGMWVRQRDRGNAVRAAVLVALLALLFVFDRAFESPREQGKRKTEEMAAAASAELAKPAGQRNWDALGANVSADFDFNGVKKDGFLAALKSEADAAPDGSSVSVRDFDRSAVVYPSDTEKAKAAGVGENEVLVPFNVLAFPPGADFTAPQLRFGVDGVWKKDPDGQYRLRTLKLYKLTDAGARGEEMKALKRP